MTQLNYYLSLMNQKYSISEQKQIGYDFLELGSKFCDIAHSKYHPLNKGKLEKDIYLPMIYLFEEYKIHGDGKFIYFQFPNYKEYYLCLIFLDQIKHKYQTIHSEFIIKSDITRTQWYEYLFQQTQ